MTDYSEETPENNGLLAERFRTFPPVVVDVETV